MRKGFLVQYKLILNLFFLPQILSSFFICDTQHLHFVLTPLLCTLLLQSARKRERHSCHDFWISISVLVWGCFHIKDINSRGSKGLALPPFPKEKARE